MNEYLTLRKIGLSKTAVECYQSLDTEGAIYVTDLAARLGRPRTGLYRVLKRLEKQGFVISLKTDLQPVYFYAQPADKALDNFANYQHQLLVKLIAQQSQ